MVAVSGVGVWRLILALRKRREPRRGEEALQYEIWYMLRQKDAAAAERFLARLWGQMAAERSRVGAAPAAGAGGHRLLEAQVAELSGAVEVLRRGHAGDAALPPALAVLESKVRELCGDLAALQPGGTP